MLAVSRAERPSDLIAAMPLAVQPVQGELAAEKGKLRFVVADGTAYGLDASTGKLLWRRFLAEVPPAKGKSGEAKPPAVSVLRVADSAGSDVVICDPVHRELLRVNGRTGGLLWRLAVGQPIAAGPGARSTALLAAHPRPPAVDHRCRHRESKPLPGFAANRAAAAGCGRRARLDLPGCPTIKYLRADLRSGGRAACRQVLHLGHEAGTIAAAPCVSGDFLFVPVNDSPDQATVRVLSIAAARKEEPLALVQRINLKGFIDASPVALRRRRDRRYSPRRHGCDPAQRSRRQAIPRDRPRRAGPG